MGTILRTLQWNGKAGRSAPAVLLALVVMLAGLGVTGSQAATTIPNRVGFEGYLTDSGGNPLATGTYSITFAVYSAATGGSALWTETQSSVAVNQGYYAVQLGSVTTLPGTLFNGDRWIGVKVGTNPEISPRTQVLSVPYAFSADTANSADSVPWSGVSGKPAGFSDGVDNDTTYTAGNGLTLTGTQFTINTAQTQSRVTGSCPAGQYMRVIAADGTVTCQADANSGGTVTGSGVAGGLALWGSSSGLTNNAGLTASGSALNVGGGLNVGSASGAGTGDVRLSGSIRQSTPVAARVYMTGAVGLPNVTATYFAFNAERYDPLNMHDNAVNPRRITVPVAGIFLLDCGVRFDPSTSQSVRSVNLYVSGVEVGADNGLAPASTAIHVGATTTYFMNAGDYAECSAFQNSGVTINATVLSNRSIEFSVARLP